MIILSLFGCTKDSYNFPPNGMDRVVEGTVFEDCSGNVSKGEKI
jgi:hypothetical protein